VTPLDAFLAVDLVPLATAVLAAATCATLGNWLVLRKQAMLGDATSHAVLPGIVVAFLVVGTRDPWALFVGATVAGAVAALVAESLRRVARIESGAALGASLVVAFALGIYLLELGSLRNVDLDPDCVVFGSLEGLFWIPPAGAAHLSPAGLSTLPGEFRALGAVAAVSLFGERLLRGRLAIASFDPEFAELAGARPARIARLLVVAVAAAAVASFTAVGSILVVALLVAPPVAARFWTDRLAVQARLSIAFATVAALFGYAISASLPTPVNAAGTIAGMAGVLVALSMLASPSHGALAAWLRHRELARSLAAEDMLGVLGRAAEMGAGGCDAATLVAAGGGNGAARRGFLSLRRRALIALDDGQWTLTAAGMEAAREILSRHRGWQDFLVTRTGMPPDHAHEAAHRLEHLRSDPKENGS
jgi:manganese/zinc/iron transport system permease protein